MVCSVISDNIIAAMFSGFKPFTYWQLDDDDKSQKEDYTVKL